MKIVVKTCLFLIKDDELWDKYDKVWDVIKNKLDIKFHSEPVYGVIKTNFLNNGMPKEKMYYSCIACITIDPVLTRDKKKSSTSLFRRV